MRTTLPYLIRAIAGAAAGGGLGKINSTLSPLVPLRPITPAHASFDRHRTVIGSFSKVILFHDYQLPVSRVEGEGRAGHSLLILQSVYGAMQHLIYLISLMHLHLMPCHEHPPTTLLLLCI